MPDLDDATAPAGARSTTEPSTATPTVRSPVAELAREPSHAQDEVSADAYVEWLASNAMLERASRLAQAVTKTRGTVRPFAEPQPRMASALAPAWLTVYPASHLARPGESVLAALGDDQLWATLLELGIRGMHTGPMKRSGGVSGRALTPTVDGYFDPASAWTSTPRSAPRRSTFADRHRAQPRRDCDRRHHPWPHRQRVRLPARRARVPRLSGPLHIIEIDAAHWSLLPAVPAGKDSVNLSPEVLDRLVADGVRAGPAAADHLFYTKGVKETDFSATDVVIGVDGRPRRWVYLHYFKEGQPTLDWLDASFGAQRLVLGDAVHSLRTLGDSMLRLDANGFLGIEPRPGEAAWSEGHPLSLTSNQLIAGLVRRLGGFTFQELNLTFEDLRDMSAAAPIVVRLRVPARVPSRAGHGRHRVLAPRARAPARERDRSGGAGPRAPESRRADARARALLRGSRGRSVPARWARAARQRAARHRPR